ncbi:MAG TPA: dihydrodipicolinate synthase family protein [Thermoplasmata archaeon]|nr:dihydrodipicolinate synthase family protein [Thermoplasmata archaeon]
MNAVLTTVVAFYGLAVPTATLFDDRGDVDPERNRSFIRGLCEGGMEHAFALGSLGEFPLLERDERDRLLRAVRDGLTGTTDLWVGCGAPSTRQALALTRAAEASGAAVIVAVAPYYLHPEPAAIARYYRALRAATKLPLFAYNIPSLVGYAIAPSLVHELARDGTLQGVKDTSGSLASVRSFLQGAPSGFAVLPGDDALAAASIREGAAGAIMGSANVLPKLGAELVSAAHRGDEASVQRLQGVLEHLMAVLHAGPFPASGKFLARRLRGAPDGYRSPYDPLTPEEETRVLAALAPYDKELAGFR